MCTDAHFGVREFLLYSFSPFANFHIEFCQKLLKLIKEKDQTRTHHKICEIYEGECDQNLTRIQCDSWSFVPFYIIIISIIIYTVTAFHLRVTIYHYKYSSLFTYSSLLVEFLTFILLLVELCFP